jgi:hypothetical protein
MCHACVRGVLLSVPRPVSRMNDTAALLLPMPGDRTLTDGHSYLGGLTLACQVLRTAEEASHAHSTQAESFGGLKQAT